ncbi:MAG: multi-sensor signal transduction histidine kinase, partial [Sporomusa sp.]|nr:multi-sensor signal transduction histidine kinase [Sporomusa sp.]
MGFYELSIIATLSATFAVVCVYFFLFWLYRQPYIGLWAIFWLTHFLTQIFYSTPLHKISTPILIGIQFISIINYTLLVYATCKFFGRKMDIRWYYWGIAMSLLSDIAVLL